MQSTAEPGPRKRLLASTARLLPRDCPAPGVVIHELALQIQGKITSKGGRKGWGRNMHQEQAGCGSRCSLARGWMCRSCSCAAFLKLEQVQQPFPHQGCRTRSRPANPTPKHHSLFLQQNNPAFGRVSGHIRLLRFGVSAKGVCIHNRIFVRISLFLASFPGRFDGNGEVIQRISHWMSGIQWCCSPSTPACWQSAFSDIK